jgi:transcription-repair coupling factor (superfamily II helicase)
VLASISPSTTSKYAAPAKCSATASLAKCRKSASICSPRCSTAPVAALKQGKRRQTSCSRWAITTEINLHTPALLPNDYAPDVQQRLALYKRLANCTTGDDIADLQEELVDRFGELPPQARALLDSHRLRCLCKPLGVSKLDATGEQIVVQFEAEPPIDPMCIINLIQRDRNYRLSGPDKLLLKRHCPTLADRVSAVKDMIHQLSRLPKP